jgi:hypothetical protein
MKKLFLILLVISLHVNAFEIEHDRLGKPVSKFLSTHQLFDLYAPSCLGLYRCQRFTFDRHTFLEDQYRYHEKTYDLPVSKAQFFSALTRFHPRDIWKGDSRFELSMNFNQNQLYYKDDDHPGLIEGDIVFLELTARLNKLIKTKIPVAFQIIKIDEFSGEVSFSYLKQNKSKGIQHLQVTEHDDGSISIRHMSRFQSGSDLRDDRLYAPIHEKLTDDFYFQLERLILSQP